ncbi:unnamed protein product, partial [Tetraodon nigroviridis]
SLEWVFGMNPVLPAISLQDQDQLVILYAGAHVGVIYNHTLNSQYMLQGHCHSISCMCVSADRRWIATADQGPESVVMVWDSFSGIPAQTLFNCHPKKGVAAIALSSDTQLLVTLGAEEIQRVCIWKWMDEAESPLWCTELKAKHGFQGNISFNPNDNRQLLSCSESHVLFYNTVTPRGCDKAPDITEIVNLPAEALHMTVFHCKEPLIITATSAGSLMLWDVGGYITATKNFPKVKCKILPLQNAPITCLATTDNYIVTGDTEGHIIFYDEGFKLLFRYMEFSLDTIISISFSKEFTEGPLDNYSLQGERHIIRNFVVSTVSSIVHVKTREKLTQTLLQKDCEPLRTVSCNPKESTVAIGKGSGLLQVWDYSSKTIVCSRLFENEKIRCIAFDPQGEPSLAGCLCLHDLQLVDLCKELCVVLSFLTALYLAVGFESGTVHLVNPQTLQSCPEDSFHYSKVRIHLLAFSLDSNYFATAVEYDLQKSTVDNLLILSSVRIEQTAVPLCMVWYPPVTGEDFLLTASDHYKMKLYDSTSMMCRKTILGPTYGSPVEKVLVLPMSADTGKRYLAYVTKDKLGLQILPLDGNPYKSNALICHADGVSTLTHSYDSCFVFTAGSSDCTVLSWRINLDVLEAAAALGGNDMVPFYTMLEGGRDGHFYKEMEEFFFYCQIYSQGIDTMERRQISAKIPLTEVASLMRALGYFPTNHEIKDIENEVKFSEFAETGTYVTSINIEEFIKLYINHRPVLGICEEFIQAFNVLGDCDGAGQLVLQKEELLKMLKERGEAMTREEMWQASQHC